MINNYLTKSPVILKKGSWYLAEGNCPKCEEFIAIIDCAEVKFCPYCGENISVNVYIRKDYTLSEVPDEK